MSKVPLIISWPIEPMPQLGAYEVWVHTADIDPLSDVLTTATKIDEVRGHSTEYGAEPETSIYVFIRYRNDPTGDYSDWITGNITTGKVALRTVTAPLERSDSTISLAFDASQLEVNGSGELAILESVLSAKADTVSGSYTAPEVAHDFGMVMDQTEVEAALDALGSLIAELQTKLVSAGIGE